MNKIKVLISTGQGRLHLIESALSIKNAEVNVNVITGWVPSKYFPDGFVNLIGRLVGRNNISYGLRKRHPYGLNSNEIKTTGFAEFLMHFLFVMAKFKLISHDVAEVFGWKVFGIQSKKYIRNADIFHVRTAAGNSGAIKKARREGMIILADQSAAHPYEIYKQLSKAYEGKDIPFEPDAGLWKLVLDDCKESDYILTSCEYVKWSLIQHGFDEKLIYSIPLGIREDFANLKTSFKKDTAIKLLYTGSFRRWKGSHLIIEVIERFIKMDIKFHIDIIGSVSDDMYIPDWFLNHQEVKMHGYIPQDDLKLFLANSDLYIFPSYCDGGAQSQKEAMAAGLPVITSTKSGSPIIHGENGWIIPDNSSQALFDAIITLANDEQLREKLGKNAAITISRDHTWEKYGKDVAHLYETLLEKRNK